MALKVDAESTPAATSSPSTSGLDSDSHEVFRRLSEKDLLELIGPKTIFVFWSDLSGFHCDGDARAAVLYWGAQPGVSVGFCGHSYAIPVLTST